MLDLDIVFIIGIGRSGTSLLQNMLNANSSICFLPENSFARRYLASRLFDKRIANAGSHVFAQELTTDDGFKRLGLSCSGLAAILDDEEIGTGTRFFKKIMHEYAMREPACRFVGDKDPRLIEYLPMLAASFPNAYVIHIYRDPRDVVLSKTKAEWSRNRFFLTNLFAGRVQWALACRTGQRLFGTRFYELAYEDLISSPQDVLERICDYLGVVFEQNMLCPATGGGELVADDEMSWKKESLGPVLKENRGKWRKGLSPYHVALTESVCRAMMKEAGYSQSTAERSVGPLYKFWIELQATLLKIFEVPYCWYRIWKQPK